MKNPVLARFFAVVLAVISLISICSAAYNLKKVEKATAANEEKYELLSSRISSYEEYSEILEGAEPYSLQLEAYEQRKAEYDSLSAQHKTDLAVYSATKGGIAEAKETLEETPGLLFTAGATLQQGQQQFEEKKQQFEQAKAAITAAGGEEGVAAAIEALKSAISTIEAGFAAAAEANEQLAMLKAAIDYAADEEEKAALQAQYDGAYAAFISACREATPQYAQCTSQLSQLQTLAAMIPQLPELEQQLAAAEEQLKQAQSQLQYGWDAWSLGGVELDKMEKELPETRETLEEEKLQLEKEGVELAEINEELEELKSNEKHLSSLETLLLSNTRIKAAVEEGEELLSAARAELERFGEELKESDFLARLTDYLLIAAGAFGLAALPASFEKLKSRFFLLFPVILYALCCAGAELISLRAGNGQNYVAICAGIIGLIHLLIIIPREKTT